MSATGTSPKGRSGRRLWVALGGIIAVIVVAAVVVVIASRSSPTAAKLPPVHVRAQGPEAMFTSATVEQYTPAIVSQLQAMGFDRVHIYMHWADIAPHKSSLVKPAFDATDPAAYPASGWAPFDDAIRLLESHHLNIDLDLVSPPPNWAEGKGAPNPRTQPEWEPSASDFGQFVRAVATRYDGHYTPPGQSRPLPRVSFWSIWNEPDLGVWLAPEILNGVEVAPRLYRNMVNAAWKAYKATGHGKDTILIGELAPAGIHSGTIGKFNSMPPLQFLRGLYCVGSNYRPLQGTAATEVGCPATAAQSAKFAARNPALFHASGVAIHPYTQGLAPNQPVPNESDYAVQADLPHVEAVLDQLQRVYGSHTKFPLWSTEFGYQTSPPDTEAGTVSPEKAAEYLNWSEYLTWSDPRQKSFDQYLLSDNPAGNFATGLQTAGGAAKPGYGAFLMPLYLPVTATTKGHPLLVWGGVRSAHHLSQSTHQRQVVHIQYSPGGGSPFRTVQTVPIINSWGYFEVRHTFPGSGQVRLEWVPKGFPNEYSRVVKITVQ